MTPPSIIGLTVEMPTPCHLRSCGCMTVKVHAGGAHGVVRCTRCAAYRGTVSKMSRDFLAEIIRVFGTITEPGAIRLGATSDVAKARAATDDYRQ